MKLFNSKIEYGFKALSFLAKQNGNDVMNSRIISNKLAIPKEYTAKILQDFARSGILNSKKGKHGGFVFAKNPKDISIGEVFKSLGFNVENDKCVLGFKSSSSCSECFINDHWNSFTVSFSNSLNKHSLDYITEKH